MARPNKYQYETSPRKLEPDYTPRKKPRVPKKTTARSPIPEDKNRKVKNKINSKALRKKKSRTVMYIIIGFVILFAISYRNSQIDENFAKVQNLKQELSEVEKENAQLEIAIENSTNLNNIEQQAKALLGMQKLSNRQTVYVDLPKTDYIEPAAEEVIIGENTPIFKSIMDGIMNIFK